MSIKKFREDATMLVLARLLKTEESPALMTLPDELLEIPEIDQDWLLSEALCWEAPEIGKPAEERPVIEPTSGRKPITIRVPNRVMRAFRRRAESTGTAYQTLMNRALQDAADAFDKAAYL